MDEGRVDISLGEETLNNVLEALNQKGEVLRPEALQDMSVDTSLLLERDMFFPPKSKTETATKTNLTSYNRKPTTTTTNNNNIESLGDDERKRYEAEIAFLKKKLIEQRIHFQKLLELPADLERDLRKELGDRRFDQIYQNKQTQKRN